MSKQKGFTLIEALVYIGLFTIVVGGLITASYGFFESLDRNQTRAMLQAEQDFIIAKIDWALDGAQSVTVPSSSSVSVTKWDTSIGNPVQICAAGSAVRILLGVGTCSTAGQMLTNTNVTISNLVFIRTVAAGINAPESVEAGFTISAKTPTGATISQTASTTRYLHK
jgi:type II secretory pathway pseudopilin PulG